MHPSKKESSRTTFQDFTEKMIVPVAQVMSITLEPSKGNTQVGRINKNFDKKSLHIIRKIRLQLLKSNKVRRTHGTSHW